MCVLKTAFLKDNGTLAPFPLFLNLWDLFICMDLQSRKHNWLIPAWFLQLSSLSWFSRTGYFILQYTLSSLISPVCLLQTWASGPLCVIPLLLPVWSRITFQFYYQTVINLFYFLLMYSVQKLKATINVYMN